jgi:hypothetical protein
LHFTGEIILDISPRLAIGKQPKLTSAIKALPFSSLYLNFCIYFTFYVIDGFSFQNRQRFIAVAVNARPPEISIGSNKASFSLCNQLSLLG